MSIAVIINSCNGFYETTIPSIIESCKLANIPSSNIYVVVGECDIETDIIQKEDYNIVFCKYVNIDYNAAIYFTQTERGRSELKKYTHFFYVHDTCTFTELFWKNIQTFTDKCNMYIKIEYISSKNIGLLNVDWFLENKSELFSYYINYDKNLRMLYKNANFPNRDEIYSKFNNLARWLNEDCMFIFDPNFTPLGEFFQNTIRQYMTPIYSNEPRMAFVYDMPGLIKYHRNWGDPNWKLSL
jgi:hypothetical protein